MQDPSFGVPAQLLQHMHLVCTRPFPISQHQMQPDMIVRYLQSASQLVRSAAPMRWEFWQPPRDGSVFLVWQPTSQLGDNFASDGYVWAEPEQMNEANIGGYIIQMFSYSAGYIPGREQICSHRRFRYRLRAAPNQIPIEQNLELVHYIQASPEHRMPSNRIQTKPNLQTVLMTRSWLEQAGPIERKEFMLHDTNSWPRLNLPSQRMPPNPYQNPAMARPGMPAPGQPPVPQAMFNQPPGMRPGGPMGPSPAKRARHAPPVPMPRPLGEIDNPAIAEEEAAAAGDLLDLLTPRELSQVRFKQHHEWMEEILASPYATSQIVPVRVHFPLAGELGAITKEILEPTAKDGTSDASFTPEKVAELEKRVQDYQKSGEDQIAKMKAEHAQKLAAMKQQQEFAQLERQLGEASRNGGDGTEAIQAVIDAVEKLTKSKIATRDDIVQVQKGGLLKRGEEHMGRTSNQPSSNNASAPQVPTNGADGLGQGDNVGSADEFADFANLDSAGEALQDFYTNNYDSMDFQT